MIIKNLVLVSVAGISGFAGAEEVAAKWKVGGELRVDSQQSTMVTTPATAGAAKVTAKSSEMVLNTANINFVGTHGTDTLNFSYSAGTNELKNATISHKFTDMVSATFGKMTLLSQSWETSYADTDDYLMSLAGAQDPGEHNGAKIDLSFGDHGVSLQAMEGLHSVSSGGGTTTFNPSGMMSTAFQYRGAIAGMIHPLVSYTMVKPSSSRGNNVVISGNKSTSVDQVYGNGYQTQMGIGAQVAVAGATVDAELDTVKFNKQTVVGTTTKDSNIQSIVLQAKYPVGMTTPIFKMTSDSHKMGMDGNVGDISQTQFAIGAEHKLDSNCRLHAIFTSKSSTTKETSSTSEKVSSTGFNIGVTAAM